MSQFFDSNNQLTFELDGSSRLQYRVRSSNVTVVSLTSTTSVVSGRWYHVLYYRSVDDHAIYVNGMQDAWVSVSSNVAGLGRPL